MESPDGAVEGRPDYPEGPVHSGTAFHEGPDYEQDSMVEYLTMQRYSYVFCVFPNIVI